MAETILRLCGECEHWRKEGPREGILQYGRCSLTGRMRERCDLTEGCRSYHYDRDRAAKLPKVPHPYGQHPEKIIRKVRCMNTGEEWPTIKAAAEAYGISETTMRYVIDHNHTTTRGAPKGLRFRMVREVQV